METNAGSAGARTAVEARLPAGARTPEELETLLEDALVMGDRIALAGLFEAQALLVVGDLPPARTSEEIARRALVQRGSGEVYIADPRQVVQAHDLALILGDAATSVARRGDDGAWRYVIARLA